MKICFSYILFLISVISIHGQVDLRVIPDKRDLSIDQELKLTVVLEIQGNDFNIQSPLQMPDLSKFNILTTGSENNTDLNIRTKTIVFQVLLQPKQTGRIKVGSVLYTANNKIYKTEPFDVYVTNATKKAIVKPSIANEMYLNLEVKDKTIYKNQPTIAVLKAYSKNFDNFRNVSKIKFPKNGDVNFHQISFAKSDIEQDEDSNMSSQVIGVFLITTSESGEIKIPSVSATVRNNSSSAVLRSRKVTLNVKKLPGKAPENYRNAVGNFNVDMSTTVEENNLVGKPINLNVKVSGEGNLHTMDLPKLAESPEYSFFAPKITYNVKNSKKGSAGNIVLNYIIIPKTTGKIILKTEDFSYFDPEKKAYKNLPSDTLSFASLTSDELNDTKTAIEKVNEYTTNVLSTVHTPKIIAQQLQIPKAHELNYKIILGNLALLCGLLFLIFKYRDKKRKKVSFAKNIKAAPVENIAEAEARLIKDKPFDFASEISYLEVLNHNQDFTTFFTSFENFQKDLEIYSERKSDLTFNNYLIQNKGAKFAEDFRNLIHEFSMEKYTPVHDPENINVIFNKLKNIISEIKE
ncbi:BatD family protein [Halpernia frigidisoli]|uniref:Oxygen tolerance n=1 Tax=Halpernia frigidisoli TaxID=1125876 RepID=A0A1I3FI28_9FLAO|nr:BatD family protein [Halpernia frigidisoli]SFI10551.1 Oxygen tolerance [Halpernia frigidisoli]